MKQEFLLIIVLIAFSACQGNESHEPEKQTPEITDMSPVFTSLSSLAPFEDKNALLKILNNSALQIARSKGDDTAVLMARKDSSGNVEAPTKYDDVYFFPVTSDSELVNKIAHSSSFTLQEDTQKVHSIDFNRNIALVITHPPDFGKGMYSNSLSLENMQNNTALVNLSYDKIDDEGIGASNQWQTSVYTVPKKNYDRIAVLLNGDTTFFTVKK